MGVSHLPNITELKIGDISAVLPFVLRDRCLSTRAKVLIVTAPLTIL